MTAQSLGEFLASELRSTLFAPRLSPQLSALKSWLGTGSINVFGAPMSEKDEICRRLAADFGGITISSGDIIRNAEQNILHHSITSSGRYFPSGYFYQLVLPYLKNPSFKSRPLFLASVGRSDGEEVLITKVLHDSEHDLKAVIILNMPEAVSFNLRERAQKSAPWTLHPEDSNATLFQVKLREYRMKTLPVLARYRARALAVDIDATQPPADLYADCLNKLYYFMTHQ